MISAQSFTPGAPWATRAWQRVLWLGEVIRVLAVAARIEEARLREGPEPLLRRLRAEGARIPPRDQAGRARLARAITSVDARFAGGSNCYRRVLLEVALDADAAARPVMFGLKAGGGPGS